MYLNRNFHSNPTLSYSGLRYFILDYLYFFSPRKWKHLGVSSKRTRGYESVFLVNLLITAI